MMPIIIFFFTYLVTRLLVKGVISFFSFFLSVHIALLFLSDGKRKRYIDTYSQNSISDALICPHLIKCYLCPVYYQPH